MVHRLWMSLQIKLNLRACWELLMMILLFYSRRSSVTWSKRSVDNGVAHMNVIYGQHAQPWSTLRRKHHTLTKQLPRFLAQRIVLNKKNHSLEAKISVILPHINLELSSFWLLINILRETFCTLVIMMLMKWL